VRPDGQVAWIFRAADKIASAPLVAGDGAILVGSQDDRLYCLERDGRLRWSVDLGGDVDASPVLGPDGVVYVGADDRALHALK
jgi:outer membrane protein assembly factor BamB